MEQSLDLEGEEDDELNYNNQRVKSQKSPEGVNPSRTKRLVPLELELVTTC